jgi:protein TonB
VLSHRIERSSGHASLDAAVEAMLERARPLPAMPSDMAQARLELSLPVTFELR